MNESEGHYRCRNEGGAQLNGQDYRKAPFTGFARHTRQGIRPGDTIIALNYSTAAED